MAARFEALDDFLDDWLELPVLCTDGQTRTFRIPSPPAEDGLRVDQLTMAAARLALGGAPADQEVLNDDEERDLFKLVLGPVHEEIAPHLSWSRYRHVAMTAMVWITSNRENAAAYWATGKVSAPNRAARRSQPSVSSVSAAANGTRSRGSTSGTRADSPRAGSGKGKGGRARRR
jgi:hypothetical protein